MQNFRLSYFDLKVHKEFLFRKLIYINILTIAFAQFSPSIAEETIPPA